MKNSSIQFNSSNIKELFSKKFLLVILISIPSAIVADYFNIPLAWMLGPMLVVSIVALSGLKIRMPKLALSSILIVLGLHIGNYIDQNLINQMTEWVWTSIIMFVYILISILIVSKYLQKFSGYNVKTSIFSAAPGALGPLMILAEHEKSDLSQVATSHLIRLIIIITVIPFFVVNYSTNEALTIEKFDYLDTCRTAGIQHTCPSMPRCWLHISQSPKPSLPFPTHPKRRRRLTLRTPTSAASKIWYTHTHTHTHTYPHAPASAHAHRHGHGHIHTRTRTHTRTLTPPTRSLHPHTGTHTRAHTLMAGRSNRSEFVLPRQTVCGVSRGLVRGQVPGATQRRAL